MAKKNLKDFLVRLSEELERTSDVYRNEIAYLRTHIFSLSREGLFSEVVTQIAEDAKIPRDQLAALHGVKIRKETNKAYDSIEDAFRSIRNGTPEIAVYSSDFSGGQKFNIELRLLSNLTTKKYPSIEKDITNTFNAIKSIYKPGVIVLRAGLRNIYKDLGSTINEFRFLDLGHMEKQDEKDYYAGPVIEKRVSEELLKYGEHLPRSLARVPAVDALFKVSKDTKTDKMKVTLESATINRFLGSTSQAAFKKEMQEKIKKALEAMDIGRMSSSDSFEVVAKKRVAQSIAKEIKKSTKKVSISGKDFEPIKHSSPSTTVLTKKYKAVRVASKSKKVSRVKSSSRAIPEPTVNLRQLFIILKARIQEQVANNMQAPALVYRTGRFASSVQITDVSKTSKGFPSVGYTYDKYPYQTFEVGFRQGSVERDPRALIDKSIREIAIEMAMGRFYTRRV